MFDIYLATCLINGKVYVGQTQCGIPRRWYQHKQNAASGSKKCPYFYNALRKYGSENFLVVSLEKADTKEQADDLEREWIRTAKATDRACGYNQMDGGEGGFLHSEETKAKMSKTATGRTESEETKQKLSATKKVVYKLFVDTVSSEYVASLYRSGSSVQDLVKRFGVPLNLIGKKLRDAGVQIATIGGAKVRADRLIKEGKQHLINPDNAELFRLKETGLTLYDLGKIYEMGYQSIGRRIQIYKKTIPERASCSESVEELGPSDALEESLFS